MDAETATTAVTITALQLIYAAAIIERATKNVRDMVSPKNGPWPEIACAISVLVALLFNLQALKGGLGAAAADLWFIPGRLADNIITGMTMAGGASGIVQTVKKWNDRKDQLLAAKKPPAS